MSKGASAAAAPTSSASSSAPSAASSPYRASNVSSAYSRFLPPKSGLSVTVAESGQGNPESAISRLHSMGMQTGLMRDWTFRSPLAPGTNRYEKPTQRRQRLERKGAWQYKQNQLLTILRTVLFKKTRG